MACFASLTEGDAPTSSETFSGHVSGEDESSFVMVSHGSGASAAAASDGPTPDVVVVERGELPELPPSPPAHLVHHRTLF